MPTVSRDNTIASEWVRLLKKTLIAYCPEALPAQHNRVSSRTSCTYAVVEADVVFVFICPLSNDLEMIICSP